jgi:hypothetical protein
MLINPTFASHIEAVPKLFAVLKEAMPFVEKGLVTQRQRAGIYAFFENEIPLYVGRTRNLQQRIRGHISVSHFSATFVFKMARRKLGASGNLQCGWSTSAASERSCVQAGVSSADRAR